MTPTSETRVVPDAATVCKTLAPYLGATATNDWSGLRDDDAVSMSVKLRVGDLRALKDVAAAPAAPATEPVSKLPLKQWREWARRDDWHNLFVGSDIRQLISEVERLSSAPPAPVAASAVTYTVFDWAYTDPETNRQMYARTPEVAESLRQNGIAITPVYAATPSSPNPVADNPAGDPVVNAPRVRELEWTDLGNGTSFRALLPIIGSVRVEPYGCCGWWEVLWSMPGMCDKLIPDVFDNPEAAKAAAQADYERRVLACLEPGQGWRDINSAPHETVVLLAIPPSLAGEVWTFEAGPASTGRRYDSGVSSMSYHGYATHWMPLPPPPAAEGSR